MDSGPTIGVLSPKYGGLYFGTILANIHQVVKQHNGRVIAIQTIARHLHGDEQPIFNSELAWDQIDGWIILVDAVQKDYIEWLKEQGKAVVLISAPEDFNEFPVVVPDNFAGTLQATRHLIEHGHTNIAFVGYSGHHDIKERLEGYKAALTERGIPINEKLIFEAKDNNSAGGSSAGIRMLRSRSPFTAVIAGTDLNAIGLIEVLRSGGLRIPEDVAIIGFDDIAISETIDPPLSSVRQRVDFIAREAAEIILKQIKGKQTAATKYKIPTDLILRRSCGCQLKITPPDETAYTEQNYINYESKMRYEDLILNSYKIIKDLYILMVNGFIDLSWLQGGNVRWACLGLHENKLDGRSDLHIERFFSVDDENSPPPGKIYKVNEFPPQEFFPSSVSPGGDNILVLLPLKTQVQDWGVLALSLSVETRPLTDNSVMEEWAELLTIILENETSSNELKTKLAKINMTPEEFSDAMTSWQDQDKLLGKFLDTIAGELRAYLRAVSDNVEIMARQTHDDKMLANLSFTSIQLKNLFRLLTDIENLPRKRSL